MTTALTETKLPEVAWSSAAIVKDVLENKDGVAIVYTPILANGELGGKPERCYLNRLNRVGGQNVELDGFEAILAAVNAALASKEQIGFAGYAVYSSKNDNYSWKLTSLVESPLRVTPRDQHPRGGIVGPAPTAPAAPAPSITSALSREESLVLAALQVAAAARPGASLGEIISLSKGVEDYLAARFAPAPEAPLTEEELVHVVRGEGKLAGALYFHAAPLTKDETQSLHPLGLTIVDEKYARTFAGAPEGMLFTSKVKAEHEEKFLALFGRRIVWVEVEEDTEVPF